MEINKKILIGTRISAIIVAILLLSGCVDEKPDICSTNNITLCNISCDTDSDCQGTCCGCINKNETCKFEEGVLCKIPVCKCANRKCEISFASNPINSSNVTTDGMDKIEDAIKKKLNKTK